MNTFYHTILILSIVYEYLLAKRALLVIINASKTRIQKGNEMNDRDPSSQQNDTLAANEAFREKLEKDVKEVKEKIASIEQAITEQLGVGKKEAAALADEMLEDKLEADIEAAGDTPTAEQATEITDDAELVVVAGASEQLGERQSDAENPITVELGSGREPQLMDGLTQLGERDDSEALVEAATEVIDAQAAADKLYEQKRKDEAHRQRLEYITDPERMEDRPEAISELAGAFHDDWRNQNQNPHEVDGKVVYDSRTKVLVETSEGKQKWVNAGGEPEGSTELKRQDIANTPFEELDPHWQEENARAAGVVVSLLGLNVPRQEAGALIHDARLSRNEWARGGELDVPFAQLPPDEQAKNMAQYDRAIELSENDKEIHGSHTDGNPYADIETFFNKYGIQLARTINSYDGKGLKIDSTNDTVTKQIQEDLARRRTAYAEHRVNNSAFRRGMARVGIGKPYKGFKPTKPSKTR